MPPPTISCALNLCSSFCGVQDILFSMVDCSGLPQLLLLFGGDITTISIRVMASKTITTKFEVEKFDEKNNFLLWRMWVTTLLVKESTHKSLLGVEKKPSKMEDDEWVDLNVRAKVTIILCLSVEVLYNVMNEKTTACQWCKIESFYMTKGLSNKLFLKKQLYSFWMKERTPFLQHLNAFNRILSDILTLNVKLEEEDNFFVDVFSFSELWSLGDHHHVWKKDLRVGKYQVNAPEKQAEEEGRFHRGDLRIGSQEAEGGSHSRGPKKGNKGSTRKNDCYYCKQPGHLKKNCFKYKEILKKKDSPGADGACASGKQSDQASIAEEAVKDPCDVLVGSKTHRSSFNDD